MSSTVVVALPRHEQDWAQYVQVASEAFAQPCTDIAALRTEALTRVAIVDD